MRKTLIIALGAAVALVATAVALATVYTAAGVSATTAEVTTTTVSNVKTRTCTGSDDKSFAVTTGRYTGMADFTTPATQLDGPVTISARTTVDTSAVPGTKLGYVEGSFRIKDDDTRLTGRFWGTLDTDGDLAGFLAGSSRGSNAKVLGTLSGKFSPATGFVGKGLIGSASASTALAVVAGPVCRHPKHESKPKLSSVEGTISKIEGDGGVGTKVSVTSRGPSVATCTRDADSPSTAGFAVGTKVEMKCAYLGTAPNQVWTLRELKKHK